MKSSPLNQVKDSHGDKAKLLASLQQLTTDELWLSRVKRDRGLQALSNAKLLRLHRVLSLVKSEFGSRDALIGKILELTQRTKDAGYKQHLQGYTTPRLLDHCVAIAKRAKAAK